MNSLADGPSDALAGALNATATSPAEAAEILAVLIQEAPQWAVIAGSLAPIVTTLLRLSPIPTVYSFYRRKSVGSLPLMPYTALLSDSLLWLCFGLLVTDVRIIVTHVFGLSLALTYSLAYAWTYSSSGDPSNLGILPGTLKQHASFNLTVLMTAICIIIFTPHSTARNIIGFGADMGSLFMYAGPLSAVRTVLREKNASSIALPFTIACLCNGFCWFAYGWFVLREIILWGPSIIGLILASIQLALICHFGNKEDLSRTYELRPIEPIKKVTSSEFGDSDEGEFDDIDDDMEQLLHSDDTVVTTDED